MCRMYCPASRRPFCHDRWPVLLRKDNFLPSVVHAVDGLWAAPHAISTDNYFLNRDPILRDKNGQYDFENLIAMDVKQFNLDMSR